MAAQLTAEENVARYEFVARRCFEDGATSNEIAKDLGIDGIALRQWIKRHHPEMEAQLHENGEAARTTTGTDIWLKVKAQPGLIKHHIEPAEYRWLGYPITNNELDNMAFMTPKDHKRLHQGINVQEWFDVIRKGLQEGWTQGRLCEALGRNPTFCGEWIRYNWDEVPDDIKAAWLGCGWKGGNDD